MSKHISVKLAEEELSMAISGLLFSSSVNIVLTSEEDYQKKLVDLAVKLKESLPQIKLSNVEFVQEDCYEDQWSENILNNFKENLEVINFEKI